MSSFVFEKFLLDAVTLTSLGLLCWLSARSAGKKSPPTLWAGAWFCVFCLVVVNPLGLQFVGARARMVILSGIWALVAGYFLIASKRVKTEPDWDWPDPVRSKTRDGQASLLLMAVITGMLFLYGFFAFQDSISAAGGADFAELSAREVRYLQNYGESKSGGLAALLFSLGPVVGCLGLYAAKTGGRVWYWLPIGVLVMSAVSPSRTFVLNTGAVLFVFFLMLIRIPSRAQRRLQHPMRYLVVATVGAMGYFVSVGIQLEKVALSPDGSRGIIAWLDSPFFYLLGGMSALSAALEDSFNPVAGEWGRSVYLLPRLLNAAGMAVKPPETIAEYVYIPRPINIFTGFGDVYFDFGSMGVVVFFAVCGAGLHWIWHKSSVSLAASFVASVLVSTLMSMPVSSRILNIDTVFVAVAGACVFRFVDRRQRMVG